MPGRHGRGVPDDPRAAIDMEATDAAAAIAGLRHRLRRQEILEHPTVLSALRGLQDQVDEQLAYAGQSLGRHRSTASTAASQQINDASGHDQKPDPLTATTSAELVQVLWKYRSWSGSPSWRTMAKNANQMVVHSTMHAAMNSDTLPKFEVMRAIIIGCGGGEEDLKAFASAWRRIGGLITVSPLAPLPAADVARRLRRGRLPAALLHPVRQPVPPRRIKRVQKVSGVVRSCLDLTRPEPRMR
jgi:hypothetical protein